MRTITSNSCVCGLLVCNSSCPAINAHNWPYQPDLLAPYLGSQWDSIDSMLKLASFKPGQRVLDLGAGDGRVLIRAAQLGASYAEGFEINKNVYELGVQHINDSTGTGCIKFIHGDARDSHPASFDIVTLFLLPEGLKIIGPWLQQQLAARPKHKESEVNYVNYYADENASANENEIANDNRTRIVSQGWPLPLPPTPSDCSFTLRETKLMVGGTQIYLYY